MNRFLVPHLLAVAVICAPLNCCCAVRSAAQAAAPEATSADHTPFRSCCHRAQPRPTRDQHSPDGGCRCRDKQPTLYTQASESPLPKPAASGLPSVPPAWDAALAAAVALGSPGVAVQAASWFATAQERLCALAFLRL